MQSELFSTESRDENQKTEDSQEHSQENNSKKEDNTYVEDIRKKILAASLDFISIEGWTEDALSSGAQALGYTPMTHTLFPHGAAHLVHYFTMSCNAELADKMKEMTSRKEKIDHIKFIEDVLVSRLEMLEPHKSTWGSALARIMTSRMAPNQIEAILMLSDDICYYAGDRSVDFNWYTKRLGVAGIYQASELHWLGNETKSSALRMEEVRKFAASQIKCASTLYEIPFVLSSIFTTAKNVVPLNSNR